MAHLFYLTTPNQPQTPRTATTYDERQSLMHKLRGMCERRCRVGIRRDDHTTPPSYTSNNARENSISSSILGTSFVISTNVYLSSSAPRMEIYLAGYGRNFGCGWYLTTIDIELSEALLVPCTCTHHPSLSLLNLASHSSPSDGPKYTASSLHNGISCAAHCRCASRITLLSRSIMRSLIGLVNRSSGCCT